MSALCQERMLLKLLGAGQICCPVATNKTAEHGMLDFRFLKKGL